MKFFSILTDTNIPHRFEEDVICGSFIMSICARCGCYEKVLLKTCPLKFIDEEEKLIVFEIFRNNWMQGLNEHATITEYNEVAERLNNNILDTYNENKIQNPQRQESRRVAKILRRGR